MKKILAIAAMALLTLAASAQKLGRVNFTELYQLAPEADSARDQINAMQNEAQETFNSMVEEYQTKANQYQQKSATWTAAIKEAKEKELVDIQNRIQEFQQTISQELQQKQAELMNPRRLSRIWRRPRASSPSSTPAPPSISMSPPSWISPPLPASPSASRMVAPSSSSPRSSRRRPRPRHRPAINRFVNAQKTPTARPEFFCHPERSRRI